MIYAVLGAAVMFFVLSVRYTSQSQPQPNPTTNQSGQSAYTGQPPPTTTNDSDPSTTKKQAEVKPLLEQFFEKLADPIVLVTLAIAVLAWIQIGVYSEMRDHNVTVQRAYVDISHVSPGLELDPAPFLKIGIKNHGHTPGTVTAYNITLVNGVEPLPTIPKYDERLTEHVGLFLNPNELVYDDIHPHRLGGTISMGAPGMKVWLIGYVDYIDKFNIRHRAGYARVFDQTIDDKQSTAYRRKGKVGEIFVREIGENIDWTRYEQRNNLPFVTQTGYNYDRKRLPREGNDWDEEN